MTLLTAAEVSQSARAFLASRLIAKDQPRTNMRTQAC
jgi:hypothetical protein